jgi:hypothetical protein
LSGPRMPYHSIHDHPACWTLHALYSMTISSLELSHDVFL